MPSAVRIVTMLRSVLASGSYLWAVFVLVGAALALALGIAGFTVLSLRYETRSPAAPAPDLGSLGELLTAARSAGLTVDSAVPGDLSRLPSLVSEEAYRIVQEGLTNALKYSADHTATFGLCLDRETFGIRLSNPAGVQRAARAGRGLRGIEERAAVLGGTATAGPHDGRWVLSVTLPVRDVRS